MPSPTSTNPRPDGPVKKYKHEDFQLPKAERCDLVMKGGITSGVVYPAAILELATHYQLRNIGGASAGAIAAAGAAAAELGRSAPGARPDEQSPNAPVARPKLSPGFVGLQQLQDELVKQGQLVKLFRPVANRHARVLFRLFLDILDGVPAKFRFAHFVTTAGLLVLSLLTVGLILSPIWSDPKPGGYWSKLEIVTLFGISTPVAVVGFVGFLWLWNHYWRIGAKPDDCHWFVWLFDWSGVRVCGVYAAVCFAIAFFFVAIDLEVRWREHSASWPPVLQLSRAPDVLASVVLGVFLSVPTALVVYLWNLRKWGKVLKEYRYGLASGVGARDRDGVLLPGEERLTDFLHTRLHDLAGLSDGEILTFSRLKAKGINLRLMTSNLSLQQPYVFPLPTGTYFLFKKSEFENLFPPEVVQFLIDNEPKEPCLPNRESKGLPFAIETPGRDLFYLPADLPVIVAVRMSLGHPGLFSAVPLYAITQKFIADWLNKPVDSKPKISIASRDTGHVQETWFSDGGIVSNFPIHIFDRWFPDVPTFGINLADSLQMEGKKPGDSETKETVDKRYLVCPRGLEEGRRSPTAEAVYLPKPDEVAAAEWRPIDGLDQMFWAIFYTAKNHRTNALTELPGYRERIITIRLTETEGGLNLNMPPNVVGKIAKYGTQAATMLVERFCGEVPQDGTDPLPMNTPGLQLDLHRWVRLRVALAHLERELRTVRNVLREEGITAADSGNGGSDGDARAAQVASDHIRRLLGTGVVDRVELGKPDSKVYPFHLTAEQRMAMLEKLIEFADAIDNWFPKGSPLVFAIDPPSPEAIQRLVPFEGDDPWEPEQPAPIQSPPTPANGA